jgi:hypothetical protein
MDKPRSPEFVIADPVRSAVAVLRAIFLAPREFFLNFEAKGSVREPIVFVLLVSAVAAVLRLVLVLVVASVTDTAANVGVSVLEALLFVVLSPAIVALLAGAYLLSVRTFVGPVGTFVEVYRMLGYAYGAMILFWIPIVQALAFTYATLVLMLLAIRYVYRTTFLTALITALTGYIPAALFFIFLQLFVTGLAFEPPS